MEPGASDANGCVLLRVQHGRYRHRETCEQRRGRLRPACKNVLLYLYSPWGIRLRRDIH